MDNKTYILIVIDRIHATLYTVSEGLFEEFKRLGGQVDQVVKHGENTWDAQDKLFRHSQEQLHKFLTEVGKAVESYARLTHIDGIIIGSHKPLIPQVEKVFHPPFLQKVKGSFVTDLKVPFEEISKKAMKVIQQLEEAETEEQIQKSLS